MAKFRSRGRLPVLSWYNRRKGNAICRSAQPNVGLAGNVSRDDQELLAAMRQTSTNATELIIFDARSRLAAEGNRVRGHGTEDPMYGYTQCRLNFLGIENIHAMRSSVDKLRDVRRHRPLCSARLAHLLVHRAAARNDDHARNRLAVQSQ